MVKPDYKYIKKEPEKHQLGKVLRMLDQESGI